MKPFNLEAALRGEPVVTRDGRRVLGIYQFKNQSHSQNVYFEVVDTQGLISVWNVHPDGFETGKVVPRNLDLFMAPKKVTRWVLLYCTKDPCILFYYSANFTTEEEALRWRSSTGTTVYTSLGNPQAYEYED